MTKSHREIRPKNFQDNFLGLQTEPPQFRGPVQHKAQVDRQTSQEPKHPKAWEVVGCWMQLSCSIQSQMCHGSDLLIEIVPRALLGHLTTCLTPTVNLHFISSKNLLALLKHANFQKTPRWTDACLVDFPMQGSKIYVLAICQLRQQVSNKTPSTSNGQIHDHSNSPT